MDGDIQYNGLIDLIDHHILKLNGPYKLILFLHMSLDTVSAIPWSFLVFVYFIVLYFRPDHPHRGIGHAFQVYAEPPGLLSMSPAPLCAS